MDPISGCFHMVYHATCIPDTRARYRTAWVDRPRSQLLLWMLNRSARLSYERRVPLICRGQPSRPAPFREYEKQFIDRCAGDPKNGSLPTGVIRPVSSIRILMASSRSPYQSLRSRASVTSEKRSWLKANASGVRWTHPGFPSRIRTVHITSPGSETTLWLTLPTRDFESPASSQPSHRRSPCCAQASLGLVSDNGAPAQSFISGLPAWECWRRTLTMPCGAPTSFHYSGAFSGVRRRKELVPMLSHPPEHCMENTTCKTSCQVKVWIALPELSEKRLA